LPPLLLIERRRPRISIQRKELRRRGSHLLQIWAQIESCDRLSAPLWRAQLHRCTRKYGSTRSTLTRLCCSPAKIATWVQAFQATLGWGIFAHIFHQKTCPRPRPPKLGRLSLAPRLRPIYLP